MPKRQAADGMMDLINSMSLAMVCSIGSSILSGSHRQFPQVFGGLLQDHRHFNMDCGRKRDQSLQSIFSFGYDGCASNETRQSGTGPDPKKVIGPGTAPEIDWNPPYSGRQGQWTFEDSPYSRLSNTIIQYISTRNLFARSIQVQLSANDQNNSDGDSHTDHQMRPCRSCTLSSV